MIGWYIFGGVVGGFILAAVLAFVFLRWFFAPFRNRPGKRWG